MICLLETIVDILAGLGGAVLSCISLMVFRQLWGGEAVAHFDTDPSVDPGATLCFLVGGTMTLIAANCIRWAEEEQRKAKP